MDAIVEIVDVEIMETFLVRTIDGRSMIVGVVGLVMNPLDTPSADEFRVVILAARSEKGGGQRK